MEDRILDLKWYIPDLSEFEISIYLEKYWELDASGFQSAVFNEQREKNLSFDTELLEDLRNDPDFICHYRSKDNLVLITPEYFTNLQIKNFLKSHAVSIPLENWTSMLTAFKIPPKNFFPEDIAFNPNWLYFKDKFIFLHPFFWSLDDFWIDYLELYGLYKNSWVSFQIAIDFSRIVSLQHYRRIALEWARYYWKPYSDTLLLLEWYEPYFIKYIRDEEFNKFFDNKILFTEFLIDPVHQTIYIEEISEIENWGYIVNRFIHCLYDRSSWKVTHMDWSLLYYDKWNYSLRKDVTLEKKPRFAVKKEKVFRIDWPINISDWKCLMFSFFYWNEMVIEYFDEEHFECYKKEFQSWWRNAYSMEKYSNETDIFLEQAIREEYEQWPAYIIFK